MNDDELPGRNMRSLLFFFKLLALIALLAVPGMAARANSLLIADNPNPGRRFPMQGDCGRNGINPAAPGIDVTRSTWACSGASQQMMLIFYRDGPEECVYIDNFNSDGGQSHAFFIPLQTSDEWLAFADPAHRPGGLNLRYGCQGIIERDSCGNRFVLPDMPASDSAGDVITVTTSNGAYKVSYSCPLTVNGVALSQTGGCGAWVKGKESGACTVAPAATSVTPATSGTNTPGSSTGGIIPSSPTTTIPGGETPGPLIPLNPSGPTTSIPGGETPGPLINLNP